MKHFAEKYRPKNLKNIIGNKTAQKLIIEYMNSWMNGRIPPTKALLLCGPPGIGKTTIAEALANQYDIPLATWNSSDERTADVFKEIQKFIQVGSSEGTDGVRLIVLDEVDGVRGQTQRAITKLIKLSYQPIILICNNKKKVTKGVQGQCSVINMKVPSIRDTANFLLRIAKTEGLDISKDDCTAIAEKSGSVRSAITNLELVSEGELIDNIEPIIYDLEEKPAINEYFAGNRKSLDVDPGKVIFYLHDSHHYMDLIPSLDIIKGRIKGTDYRPWKYLFGIYKMLEINEPMNVPRTFWDMSRARTKVAGDQPKMEKEDEIKISKVQIVKEVLGVKKKESDSKGLDNFF